MKYQKREHIISFCKTCTWRIVASLDTFLLSWLITGNVGMGASIASLEVLTKMFLYYAHERQWEKPRFNIVYSGQVYVGKASVRQIEFLPTTFTAPSISLRSNDVRLSFRPAETNTVVVSVAHIF